MIFSKIMRFVLLLHWLRLIHVVWLGSVAFAWRRDGFSGDVVRLLDGGQTQDIVGLNIPLSRPLRMVRAYLGLQYAALGQLHNRALRRFQTAVDAFKYYTWSGVVYKTSFAPVCPQLVPNITQLSSIVPRMRLKHLRRIVPFLRNESEECLFLNVYVPTGK